MPVTGTLPLFGWRREPRCAMCPRMMADRPLDVLVRNSSEVLCVTGAPKVFLANVKGPWISPDAIEVDRLVEISHACPSGAIRYQRKDGKHDETPPQVNLAAIRSRVPAR